MAQQDEEGGRRRSLLPSLAVGAGSLALLGTVGPLPVVYLAAGSLGGWCIAQKLRGRPIAQPADFASDAEIGVHSGLMPGDDSGDSSDSEDDPDVALAKEIAVAQVVGGHISSFATQLDKASDDPATAADRALISQGLEKAFDQMPPGRVEEFMQALGPREAPPSTEEVAKLHKIVAEIRERMPEDCAAAMDRQSQLFLPPVAEASG
mmetsp:Transcript_56084/g.121308  ORF Transcript_56084/g.121308 Transcript_56084/m.121308 type:complete len:207 (+) Transcript_56084:53-673(+)